MKSKNKRQSVVQSGLLLSTLSMAISSVLYPQVAVADTGNQLRAIEEVVVSARRRMESLQDVPVAIQAFGAEQIKERGIETEADLQMNTAGLMVRATNSSNQLNFSLRGQSIDAFSYSAPAVLAYVNEVQSGGVSASSFFDLESIQVLKGPQGTLFGRNATGGAVLYQTKRPDGELGGYVKAGFGNYSNREIEGAVNVPITENMYARIAGLVRERDGWQKNLYTGTDLAEIDTKNLRISVLYEGDKFENLLVVYKGKHEGRPEGLKIRNAYPVDGNPNNGEELASGLYPEGILNSGLLEPEDNPGLFEFGFDGIADFLEKQRSADYNEVYNDLDSLNDIKNNFVSNATEYEVNSNLRIKNILGYNEVYSYQPTDIDGSPFMSLSNGDETRSYGYQYNTRQVSNEFQLSGMALDESLDYIVGVYLSKETNRNQIPLKLGGEYKAAFEPSALFFYDFVTEDKSKAIFMQGTYAFTDNLNISVGYRHTWEEIDIAPLAKDLWGSAFGAVPSKSKFDKPSWGVTLDYRLNQESMFYISQRGSWRAGGFNGVSALPDSNGVYRSTDFDPETTWDVELGYKFSGFLGGVPSQVNLALYRQIVEDAQRTVYLNVSSITGNVKEAEIKGLEVEMKFDVTDWLDVGAAYAYTDASYTEAEGNIEGFDLLFGPYGDAPENTFSAYIRTEFNLDVGLLTFRGDYYKASSTYFSNLNDTIIPGSELDSYTLVNFRLGLEEIAGSTLSITAYVRNAADEEYERGGLPLGGTIGTNATIAGEPRTFGVELAYTF